MFQKNHTYRNRYQQDVDFHISDILEQNDKGIKLSGAWLTRSRKLLLSFDEIFIKVEHFPNWSVQL